VDGQLDLFDDVVSHPQPIAADRQERRNGSLETFAAAIAHPSQRAGVGRHVGVDRAVLRALEEALADAREAGDDRPALVVLASCLDVLGAPSTPLPAPGVSLRQAGDDWLRRLETQQKSESTLVGYRVAIDDLLDWSETNGRDILTESAIVDYLHSYQERAQPAEASYYRRRRATTGASSSCASSCGGSAGATASPTRSSISPRRPSPARSATG
jgi:hypothetical protein